MDDRLQSKFETDERFPTGEWKGFWLQRPVLENRQWMNLAMSFADGKITGEGNDCVGKFVMKGRYDVASAKVVIHKSYVGKHDVLYEGWAEQDKGILGVWKIPAVGKDGFHLWPKGMKDPTGQELAAENNIPVEAGEPAASEVTSVRI